MAEAKQAEQKQPDAAALKAAYEKAAAECSAAHARAEKQKPEALAAFEAEFSKKMGLDTLRAKKKAAFAAWQAAAGNQ